MGFPPPGCTLHTQHTPIGGCVCVQMCITACTVCTTRASDVLCKCAERVCFLGSPLKKEQCSPMFVFS